MDEDLSEHLATPTESKRQDIDTDDTEDDDEDSDEDDDDNQADDISKYLGPGETESAGNLSDLNSLYGEIGYDQTSNDLADFETDDRNTSGEILFDGLASTSQDSWPKETSYNGSHNPWGNHFAETEAAAAVDSILTSDDEEVQRNLPSEFKPSHNGLDEPDDDEDEDDGEEDENEEVDDDTIVDDIFGGEESSQAFLSETGSDVTTLPSREPMAPCDVQMQSAIDSILQSSVSPCQTFYESNSYGVRSGYDQCNSVALNRSSAALSSFPNHHVTGQISDPILDEAVKSILS